MLQQKFGNILKIKNVYLISAIAFLRYTFLSTLPLKIKCFIIKASYGSQNYNQS